MQLDVHLKAKKLERKEAKRRKLVDLIALLKGIF